MIKLQVICFIERADGSFTSSELETAQKLLEFNFTCSFISEHQQLSSYSHNTSVDPDSALQTRLPIILELNEKLIICYHLIKSSRPDVIFSALVQNLFFS